MKTKATKYWEAIILYKACKGKQFAGNTTEIGLHGSQIVSGVWYNFSNVLLTQSQSGLYKNTWQILHEKWLCSSFLYIVFLLFYVNYRVKLMQITAFHL